MGPAAGTPGVEARRIHVRYGRRQVLEDVDLVAPTGAITGLVGPNGAGKSTLLAVLSGERLHHRGEVTRAGRPGRPPRGSVAYLPQRADLDPNYPIRVREVVDMGRTPLRPPWRRRTAEDRRRVEEAMARVGVVDLAEASFGELSGGQQQRVLLARSLAQGADLLLLDEPFVGVDAGTVGVLEEVLRERAQAGATVVLVDHALERARTLCEHVVLLDRVVLAAGPPQRALDPALLAATFLGEGWSSDAPGAPTATAALWGEG